MIRAGSEVNTTDSTVANEFSRECDKARCEVEKYEKFYQLHRKTLVALLSFSFRWSKP